MNWPRVKFAEVAEIVTGNTPPKKDPDNYGAGVPWVKPPDLDAWEPVTQAAENLSPKGQKLARLLPEGSVMVCCIGSIGRVGIAGTTVATNQQINSLIFGSRINPRFGHFYCRHIPKQFQSAARNAVVPILNKSNFSKIEMPLPPLSEQQRIVEILDQADALRKRRAEADQKSAHILPALFYRMFGDPATNSKGWRIGELNDVIIDTRNGLYKPAKFYGNGIGILKMFNIQHGELELSRIDLIDVNDSEFYAYKLLPGDILINRVNTPELVGKCAVITDDIGQAVFESKNIRMRIDPKQVTPEFIATFLNCPYGHGSLRRGVKHAIGMATINNTDLRKTPIFLPPIKIQSEFSKAVKNIRLLRKSTSKAKEQMDSLFQNLLFKAFSGNLTAKWREAHMKEVFTEMEEQAKVPETTNQRENTKGKTR